MNVGCEVVHIYGPPFVSCILEVLLGDSVEKLGKAGEVEVEVAGKTTERARGEEKGRVAALGRFAGEGTSWTRAAEVLSIVQTADLSLDMAWEVGPERAKV